MARKRSTKNSNNKMTSKRLLNTSEEETDFSKKNKARS